MDIFVTRSSLKISVCQRYGRKKGDRIKPDLCKYCGSGYDEDKSK